MEANICVNSEVRSFNTKPLTGTHSPVHVRNAWKSFWHRNTENKVLTNLNLTVSKGEIYGLLGPSGCGKTTLLKCITGRLSLDSGQILTFGERPGTPESPIPGPRLGYMPQEDALDGILSIKEILYYYGCLLCVPKKRLLTKITFLVDFLKLPSEKIRFSSLSGGEKRRVSFAVALVHDAELLILDEPTVGVDPILKCNIWNYLCDLVKEGGKTVITTTHYIEEARRANTVGLMFEGTLLAEGEPNHLISMHRKNTLEDVFLFVCANQKKRTGTKAPCKDAEECVSSTPLLACSEGQKIENGTATADETLFTSQLNHTCELQAPRKRCCHNRPDIQWSRCQAIIYRGFVQLFRYPGLVLIILASPAFLVAVCGFALGRPVVSIEMGVVNEDTGHLASRFLSYIDSNLIIQNNFTSSEIAQQSVREGRTWGSLKFGQNFSTALLDRYNKSVQVRRESVIDSNIDVSLDGTNFVIAETIRFVLLDSFNKFVSELLTTSNMDPALANIPIVVDNPVFGSKTEPYGSYIMPSMISGSSFFSMMGLAVISLFLDKADGKLERVYATGITTSEVVLGFVALHITVLVVEIAIMLFTSFVVLQFANKGSFVLIVALSLLQGTCGAALGLLMAALTNRFTATTVPTVTIIVVSVAFGGFFWPLETVENATRYICLALPFASPANAMRIIMFRNENLTNPKVSLGFGVTFLWTSLFLTLSTIVLRAKKSG